ncbi:hypothetical protein VTN00DRAFT_9138 [Thermoascus crustaceus]|uniref:uncharacterized protein n=1 Tax=Thermoascus crustaceus TaxID=5088 RepID=UPI0037437901
MPVVTIADLQRKKRQKKRSQSKLKLTMETKQAHTFDAGSGDEKGNTQLGHPTFFAELPLRPKTPLSEDTNLINRKTDKGEKDSKAASSALDSTGSTGPTTKIRIVGEWPRHLSFQSPTAENMVSDEPVCLLG